MDAAGLFRILIGTKSFFCFRSILHVVLKVTPHTAHRRSLLSAARSSSSRRYFARSSTVHVESSDTMRLRKAQCRAPPDSPETGNKYMYHSRESRRSCAGEKMEHQNEYNTRHSSSSAGMYVCMYVCMYTSEADFHKPGIYGGSVRVWATAWDVFRRAPSRVGRGVRVAVYFVVCFWVGRIFIGFLFLFLMRPFFAFRTKKPLHTGVRTGCHYLISLSVRLSVYPSVCV